MERISDLYVSIGELIRARRDDAGLSQAELGRLVGLTRASISNLEKGQQRIQLDALYTVAEALNVSVTSLLPPEGSGEFVAVVQNDLRSLRPQARAWARRVFVRRLEDPLNRNIGLDMISTAMSRDDQLNLVLDAAGDGAELPVPVEKAAAWLGIDLRYAPFQGELAGMILRNDRATMIGVNSLQPLTRQRFTVAHAIGHLLLHNPGFHVDYNFTPDPGGPEAEASAFASELLVPATQLGKDLKGRSIDLESEELASEIANRYQVGLQVAFLRLARTLQL